MQVGLLNVDGYYYNALLSFIDKAVEEGFILPTARHIIVSVPTAKELFKKLEVKLNPLKILTVTLNKLDHIYQSRDLVYFVV